MKKEISEQMISIMNGFPKNERNIAIYDIDDTLIDSNGNLIQPIVETFHYAISIGIKPVLITARIGTSLNIFKTSLQLYNLGLKGYLRIYFLPENRYDVSLYKFYARKHLYEEGFNAVLSVGDMNWDIGEYGGTGFLL